MFTLRKKPRNKSYLIEKGLMLYKQSLKISLPYSFTAVLFILLPQLLILSSPPLLQGATLITLTITLWLVSLILLSSLIFRLYCFCYHMPIDFFRVLRQAVSKLIPLLLLAVLYCLIVFSGTMLLIVPGLILSLSLMFSFILLLSENQNVLQTLITSHRLVWGNWWHSCAIMGIPLLFNVVVSLLAFIMIVKIDTYSSLSFSSIHLLNFFTSLVIHALLLPFTFSIALILLHDLKRISLNDRK